MFDDFCRVQSVFPPPTFLPLTHHIQYCLGEEMLLFVLLHRSLFPPVITSCICPHYCITWLRADVMTKSIYRPSVVGASFPQLHQSFTKSGEAEEEFRRNTIVRHRFLSLPELFTAVWHSKTPTCWCTYTHINMNPPLQEDVGVYVNRQCVHLDIRGPDYSVRSHAGLRPSRLASCTDFLFPGLRGPPGNQTPHNTTVPTISSPYHYITCLRRHSDVTQ